MVLLRIGNVHGIGDAVWKDATGTMMMLSLTGLMVIVDDAVSTGAPRIRL